MILTRHFIKRYYERVFNCEAILNEEYSSSAVLSDIMEKMTIHQEKAAGLIIGSNIEKVFIPVGSKYRICLKNDFAITIY